MAFSSSDTSAFTVISRAGNKPKSNSFSKISDVKEKLDTSWNSMAKTTSFSGISDLKGLSSSNSATKCGSSPRIGDANELSNLPKTESFSAIPDVKEQLDLPWNQSMTKRDSFSRISDIKELSNSWNSSFNQPNSERASIYSLSSESKQLNSSSLLSSSSASSSKTVRTFTSKKTVTKKQTKTLTTSERSVTATNASKNLELNSTSTTTATTAKSQNELLDTGEGNEWQILESSTRRLSNFSSKSTTTTTNGQKESISDEKELEIAESTIRNFSSLKGETTSSSTTATTKTKNHSNNDNKELEISDPSARDFNTLSSGSFFKAKYKEMMNGEDLFRSASSRFSMKNLNDSSGWTFDLEERDSLFPDFFPKNDAATKLSFEATWRAISPVKEIGLAKQAIKNCSWEDDEKQDNDAKIVNSWMQFFGHVKS